VVVAPSRMALSAPGLSVKRKFLMPSPTVRAEALRALELPGCAACRHGDLSERRYIRSFVIELYAEPLVLGQLRDSLGFCPRHTRQLAERVEAPAILRGTCEQVVGAALADLRAGPLHLPVSRCPACVSITGGEGGVLWYVREALPFPDVAEWYQAGRQFCLPHAISALRGARREAARPLVQAALQEPPAGSLDGGLLSHLAGTAPRAGAPTWRQRTDALARLLPGPGQAVPVLSHLRRLLAVDTCPACLEGALLERSYLGWLAQEILQYHVRVMTDGIRLCPEHIHELAREHHEAGIEFAKLRREEALGWLAALATRIEKAESPTGARWITSALAKLTGGQRSWQTALTPLTRLFECSLCSAIARKERRTLHLLLAAWGDATIRRAYQDAHGLCFRHVSQLEPGPAGALARDVLRARLEVIAWELDEAGLKSSWSVRHEPKGDETSAWLRAPVLIDGRAFRGAPARDWPREQISDSVNQEETDEMLRVRPGGDRAVSLVSPRTV
jgi:hypothetical protein